MAKEKVKRYWVSANAQQKEALDKLMAEDMQTNVSAYFGMMIAEITKFRSEKKEKRPVGRPKKEEEEEVWYPAPYEGGAPYKKADLEAYYAFRKQPLPDPMPTPLSKEELQKWDL